ncbi:phage minor tail protein L [Oceanimonas smirnovii]|uniref:phage minor tail protein L n=1 Tax=Oceanimonas smirnovii TaxID=264574 RepID=UPI003FD6452B
MRELSAQDKIDIRQIAAGADVELWEVDLTRFGGSVYRFCNETNEFGTAVIWQGVPYTRYPCQGGGFEWSGQGPSGRPKLTLANITGLITGLCDEFEELAGAIVTRRLVSVRVLDQDNFKAGNANADPTQERMVARYVIERLVSLNADIAVFELAAPTETDGALIPARVALVDTCPWMYRGPDCGYTGPPVADALDQPTSDPGKDKCSSKLAGCRLRHPEQPLPFGGFPVLTKFG